MKRVSKPTFLVVTLLIILFSASAIFGLSYYSGDIKHDIIKGADSIEWGMDFKEGVEATLIPQGEVKPTQKELNTVKSTVEKRLISSGIKDYQMYKDTENSNLIARIPQLSDDFSNDPVSTLEMLTTKGVITIRKGAEQKSDQTQMNADGTPMEQGPAGETAEIVYVTNKDIKSANPYINTESKEQKYSVLLKLKNSGDEGVEKAINENIGGTISVWLDDTMISQVSIQEPSESQGVFVLSGNFTYEDVSEISSIINSGTMPMSFKTSKIDNIDAKYSSNVLMTVAYAAIAAFVIAFILLIAIYKVPGLIAGITLLGSTSLLLGTVTRYFGVFESFVMTLPGIVGFGIVAYLGIYANVLMAEDIKEQMSKGGTLDGAVRQGSKKSTKTVVNTYIVVALISILLLIVFGGANVLSVFFGAATSGSIYSLAYIMLMGVIANLIVSVGLSKVLVKGATSFNCFNKRTSFGGAKND